MLGDHCGVCGFDGCIGVMAEKPFVRELPVLGFDGVVGLRAVKLFREGFEFCLREFELYECPKLFPLLPFWLVVEVAELPQWL